MTIKAESQVCDGQTLKLLICAGLEWLEQHQDHVNQLNVFPVPDGDTGTNMLLTLRRACIAIADSQTSHAGEIMQRAAEGALYGARGNSGVILSQLLRGLADGLAGHDVFDMDLLVSACKKAVDAAYQAVMEPVEGTILTVARETYEALTRFAPTSDDLVMALDTMVDAAKTSLVITPTLLPILAQAGVVDSGGQGLVYILEGMARATQGEPVTHTTTLQANLGDPLVPDDEEGYGYDVQFLMHGSDMDVEAVRKRIDSMGWSTLVVGESNLIKVHVHVHDPGQPISYAISTGATLDDVVVENMQAQYEQFVQRREPQDGVGLIVVANGEGFHDLFYKELKASSVIAGGTTMNPSTEDFVQAVRHSPFSQIVLLPNNGDAVPAAEQAARLVDDKDVRVVPTHTIQQGIGALLAGYDMTDLDDLVEAMQGALAETISVAVTAATRATQVDDLVIHPGDTIGLLNGKIVSVGQIVVDTMIDTLRKAGADEHELITLYYGTDVQAEDFQALAETVQGSFPDQAVEGVYGGQPLYPYLISIE